MRDVIIIGAGLSGLTTAYYLKKQKVEGLVLEARDRIGGRIYTALAPPNNTPVEMGATWFADKHVHLMSLVSELKLTTFRQYQVGVGLYETGYTAQPDTFTISTAEEPSYRLAGGTSTIIDALVNKVGSEHVVLNTRVTSITDKGDHVQISDDKGTTFTARKAVITIPPYLLVNQPIEFTPSLPYKLMDVIRQTHTWMSDSIKFAVVYDNPFWRKKGYSGTIFSQTNIASELYDHTNYEESRFALKGFLVNNAIRISKEQRQSMVVAQLVKLLGEEAGNYLSYIEKVWANDNNTHADYGQSIQPHQNSGHPIYANSLMNDKLYFSGSETSPYFGGYKDGAVYSGKNAAARVANKTIS